MNPFLLPFNKKLHLEIAQTIFADNRVYHIGKLNCHNEVATQDLELIEICKNFSLPVTILNQCFEISKDCEEMKDISRIYTNMDALISFLNLSHMSMDERIKFIKQMQIHAPKALFIDYELPERNISYPMYYTFMLGERIDYLKLVTYTYFNRKKEADKSQIVHSTKHGANFKNYLNHGALEGLIYELPNILGKTPRCIKRSHLCFGGIGLFYCEW